MQAGHVVDAQIARYFGEAELAPGDGYGARGKIHPGDLPTGLRQRKRTRPSPAAQVKGATRMVRRKIILHFRRDDTAIPGRAAQIPEVEAQAA